MNGAWQIAIAPGRPLLVLGCSQVKAPAEGFVSFFDLYDGPMWQQVKAAGFPRAQVAAVSALYGFIEPGMRVETYDVAIDEKRADRMCSTGDDVERLAQAIAKAGRTFIVGGELYQRVARAALRRYPLLAELVTFASGSYLQQRKQLGEWLRANTAAPVQGVLI
jgi:hypothetical protein